MFGATTGNCSINVAKPSPFALPDGDAQALQSPKSLYPLTIHAPPFQLQECRYAPVAETRVACRQLVQSPREARAETALALCVTLR